MNLAKKGKKFLERNKYNFDNSLIGSSVSSQIVKELEKELENQNFPSKLKLEDITGMILKWGTLEDEEILQIQISSFCNSLTNDFMKIKKGDFIFLIF